MSLKSDVAATGPTSEFVIDRISAYENTGEPDPLPRLRDAVNDAAISLASEFRLVQGDKISVFKMVPAVDGWEASGPVDFGDGDGPQPARVLARTYSFAAFDFAKAIIEHPAE